MNLKDACEWAHTIIDNRVAGGNTYRDLASDVAVDVFLAFLVEIDRLTAALRHIADPGSWVRNYGDDCSFIEWDAEECETAQEYAAMKLAENEEQK